MKIRPVGIDLLHADRQTDRQTGGRTDGRTEGQTDKHKEVSNRFSQFCECAQNIINPEPKH